jgi:hypothetical protein
MHVHVHATLLCYSDKKEKVGDTLSVGQNGVAKLPRLKDLLLDPPMVLMIQTELCENTTLKSWLLGQGELLSIFLNRYIGAN